jgi:Tol biopolymer transport system component
MLNVVLKKEEEMIKKTITILILDLSLLIAQENFLKGVSAEDLILDRIVAPTIFISPDINFTLEDGSKGIWVTNLNSKEKKQIDDRGFTPKWSPDGNLIAFLKMEILEGQYIRGHQLYGEDELWVCKPTDEDKKRITTNTQVSEFLWSPDGKFIYFEGIDSTGQPDEPYYVGVVNIATCEKKIIDVGGAYTGILFSLSPNGNMIAYCKPLKWERKIEWWVTDAEIFIANIDGSGKTQITKTEAVEVAVKWSNDGKSLLVEQKGVDPRDLSLPRYVKILLKKK